MHIHEIDGLQQILKDTVSGTVTNIYPFGDCTLNHNHDSKCRHVFSFKLCDQRKVASSSTTYIRPSDIIVYSYDDHAQRLSHLLALDVRVLYQSN